MLRSQLKYYRKDNVIHEIETKTSRIYPNNNAAKRVSCKIQDLHGPHALSLSEKLPAAKKTLAMTKEEIQ